MQGLFQQIYIENFAVQGFVGKPNMDQMQLLSSKSSQPMGEDVQEKKKEIHTCRYREGHISIDSENICKNINCMYHGMRLYDVIYSHIHICKVCCISAYLFTGIL